MGGQSRGAPTAKRAAVQAAVLDATQALLREGVSYADLNIERIATRAGISRTAFYFYFRDKRELLLRLTEDVTDELYRQGDIWFSRRRRAEAELAAAVANIGTLYREHGAVLRAIVQAAATDDEVAVFWHAILDRFVDATARRIEALRAEGRHASSPRTPRASAFALCWMIERAFNQQLVLGEPIAQEALVDALSGIFVRAVYGTLTAAVVRPTGSPRSRAARTRTRRSRGAPRRRRRSRRSVVSGRTRRRRMASRRRNFRISRT